MSFFIFPSFITCNNSLFRLPISFPVSSSSFSFLPLHLPLFHIFSLPLFPCSFPFSLLFLPPLFPFPLRLSYWHFFPFLPHSSFLLPFPALTLPRSSSYLFLFHSPPHIHFSRFNYLPFSFFSLSFLLAPFSPSLSFFPFRFFSLFSSLSFLFFSLFPPLFPPPSPFPPFPLWSFPPSFQNFPRLSRLSVGDSPTPRLATYWEKYELSCD